MKGRKFKMQKFVSTAYFFIFARDHNHFKTNRMKKITLIIAAIAFVVSVSSCKTHEKCPAYGKAGSTKTQSNS